MNKYGREQGENSGKGTGEIAYWDRKVINCGDTINSCDYDNLRSYLTSRMAILDWLHMDDGIKALDVGCGPGIFSEPLMQGNRSVTGVDFSLQMLGLARTRLTSVVQGDAVSLPFQPETFDVVLCISLVQYLPSCSPLLMALLQVVKRGGVVLVATLNPAYFPRVLIHRRVSKKLFLHSEKKVREAMSKAGFHGLRTLWIPYPIGRPFSSINQRMRIFALLAVNHYAIMGKR